jgi:hypothetical protein
MGKKNCPECQFWWFNQQRYGCLKDKDRHTYTTLTMPEKPEYCRDFKRIGEPREKDKPVPIIEPPRKWSYKGHIIELVCFSRDREEWYYIIDDVYDIGQAVATLDEAVDEINKMG